MPATALPELLELSEVRDRLHISKVCLYETVLPHLRTVKVGRRRLCYAEDLARWLGANTLGAAPETPRAEPAPALRKQGRPRRAAV